MGIVYKENKNLIKEYSEGVANVTGMLIEPGKDEVQTKLAALSKKEVETIIRKLDVMASSYYNETIAMIVAEEMQNILNLIRIVKEETKSEFGGILGSGGQLDLAWLVPKDIGGTLLNPAATASKGLYGGTSAGVHTWLKTFTANTSAELVPEQTMYQYAGMIYLGFIDPVEISKVHKAKFTVSGIPTPPQPLHFRLRRDIGTETLAVARLEKPVGVPPKKTQKVELVGGITGDSKTEPLAILIAKSQDMGF